MAFVSFPITYSSEKFQIILRSINICILPCLWVKVAVPTNGNPRLIGLC